MIPAKHCIFMLQRKVDALTSKKVRRRNMEDYCSVLTEVQNILFKEKVKEFETNKEARYELREVELKGVKMTLKKKGETSIFKLPPDCYRDFDIRVRVKCKDCGEKTIALTKIDTGDYGRSKNDSFWQSSYQWEQLFGDEAKDELHVYNGKDLEVVGGHIDYCRQPKEVHCPSLVVDGRDYIDWRGEKHTRDSGWELEQLFEEGMNLSASVLMNDLTDIRGFNLKMLNTIRTEEAKKL